MKNKIRAIVAAIAVAIVPVATAVAVAPTANAACNLHVVYTLYPWGGGVFKTTYYDVYRRFVDNRMGVASYSWVC